MVVFLLQVMNPTAVDWGTMKSKVRSKYTGGFLGGMFEKEISAILVLFSCRSILLLPSVFNSIPLVPIIISL